MAYTTIPKSSDYFNTKLYTGNGSTNNITGLDFQPDWCWLKSRNATYDHALYDAVRGATKGLATNNTESEQTVATKLTAFNSDGFSLGNNAGTNNNSTTYVSWNWKANGSGSANGDGSINSTVSVNTTSGFSIVKYTGTGSAATVGHGLGAVPKMIIVKNLSASGDWMVYHQSIGNDHRLIFNTTSAKQDNPVWNDTTPTSSVWSMNDNGDANGSGSNYVAYCFANIQGYSKFGSYYGFGGSGEPFIYTGFKPAFIITRNVTSAVNWGMFDNKRNEYNVVQNVLLPDADASETTGTAKYFDFLSNGFKVKNDSLQYNGTNEEHIFMAFAEAPLVSTNGNIATAR